jgi:hypothetical protein
MTLSIEPTADGARLTAVATDGRRTERVVKHPEALVATGLGLVMAIPPMGERAVEPPAAATPPASPPPSPGSVTPNPTPSASPSASPADTGSTSEPPPSRVALWVGAEVGGRIAQPTSVATADVALDGTLVLDPWLVSVAIRSAPVGLAASQGLDNDAFRQVVFGLGAGRRVRAGEAVLDFILEPALAAMRLEYDFPNGVESKGEDVELSIDAVIRLAVPLAKGWALTFTLEGDCLPGNVGSARARIDVPAGETAVPPTFPAWQSALRIGAMGALL